MSHKKMRYVLIAAFLLYLGISLNNHISGDGLTHISASKFIADNNQLPGIGFLGDSAPFWPPPLYHLANAVMIKLDYLIFNEFFFIRFVLPIISVVALFYLYLFIKELTRSSRVSFYSVTTLSFIPLWIDYSTNYHIGVFSAAFIFSSFYFALRRSYFLSGILFSFACLAKYPAIFAFPFLLYLYFKSSDNPLSFVKNIFKASLPLFIVPIWFIRNYLLLGNPLWPFFSQYFPNQYPVANEGAKLAQIHLGSLISIDRLYEFFFAVFGVPTGNLENVANFHLPYFELIFPLFVAGSILFTLPIVIGYFKIDRKMITYFFIWMTPFLLMLTLYTLNWGRLYARLILPTFPIFAILWSLGFCHLISKYKSLSRYFHLLLVLFLIGFSGISIAKTHIANSGWQHFEEDYDFISESIPKESTFYPRIGSLFLKTGVLPSHLPLDVSNIGEVYILLNDNWYVEPKASISLEMQEEIIQRTACQIIYDNKNTGTRICHITS